MYMRQLAYYHAMPFEAEKSRIDSVIKDLDGNPILDLPKLGKEDYLVSLLNSAGTVTQTGNGIVGLSWQELRSWQDVTNLTYPWELQIIKEMSVAYAAEYACAGIKGAQPPYSSRLILADKRKQISDATTNLFSSIIKAQEDKKCLTRLI